MFAYRDVCAEGLLAVGLSTVVSGALGTDTVPPGGCVVVCVARPRDGLAGNVRECSNTYAGSPGHAVPPLRTIECGGGRCEFARFIAMSCMRLAVALRSWAWSLGT